jgi:hypothetical protein
VAKGEFQTHYTAVGEEGAMEVNFVTNQHCVEFCDLWFSTTKNRRLCRGFVLSLILGERTVDGTIFSQSGSSASSSFVVTLTATAVEQLTTAVNCSTERRESSR